MRLRFHKLSLSTFQHLNIFFSQYNEERYKFHVITLQIMAIKNTLRHEFT